MPSFRRTFMGGRSTAWVVSSEAKLHLAGGGAAPASKQMTVESDSSRSGAAPMSRQTRKLLLGTLELPPNRHDPPTDGTAEKKCIDRIRLTNTPRRASHLR